MKSYESSKGHINMPAYIRQQSVFISDSGSSGSSTSEQKCCLRAEVGTDDYLSSLARLSRKETACHSGIYTPNVKDTAIQSYKIISSYKSFIVQILILCKDM